MKYRIAMDSAGELTDDLKNREEFVIVPLTLRIGDEEICDDGTLSQIELVKKIAACPSCPKSACPSPEDYRSAYDCDAEHVYVITVSAELSGSYQSAVIGMNMYLEDHPDVKMHVFNSKSTSVGELLILLKIKELEKENLPFEEIAERTEAYISSRNTLFTLDNLETLRKNGRLSRLKALAASVLKIKPVCYATEEGTIDQLDQARGNNKAMVKLVDYTVARTVDSGERVLGISFCNCRDRAIMVRDAILSRMHVKEVVLIETGGLSTLYANDGGIIIVI